MYGTNILCSEILIIHAERKRKISLEILNKGIPSSLSVVNFWQFLGTLIWSLLPPLPQLFHLIWSLYQRFFFKEINLLLSSTPPPQAIKRYCNARQMLACYLLYQWAALKVHSVHRFAAFLHAKNFVPLRFNEWTQHHMNYVHQLISPTASIRR